MVGTLSAFDAVTLPVKDRGVRYLRSLSQRVLRQWIVDTFHSIWWESTETWQRNTFLGFGIKQLPLDIWLYQELIYRLRPDFIVQTGVSEGGSVVFFAHLLDMIGAPASAVVVAVDIELQADARRIQHPRVRLIEGSSTSKETIEKIRAMVPQGRGFVSLDSDHRCPHVRKELELYSPFVGVGSYLVAEDTNVNGHPTAPGWGEGPFEAVEDFLRTNDQFARDDELWKRNLFSFHQYGWLKRVR